MASHESLLTSLREAREAKASLSKVLDARKMTEEIWYAVILIVHVCSSTSLITCHQELCTCVGNVGSPCM